MGYMGILLHYAQKPSSIYLRGTVNFPIYPIYPIFYLRKGGCKSTKPLPAKSLKAAIGSLVLIEGLFWEGLGFRVKETGFRGLAV